MLSFMFAGSDKDTAFLERISYFLMLQKIFLAWKVKMNTANTSKDWQAAIHYIFVFG